MEQSILQLFPPEEKAFWKQMATYQSHIQEIRFRINKPIFVVADGKEYFVSEEGALMTEERHGVFATAELLEGILLSCTKYSPYAFQEEIRQGYFTVEGGHRIGVAGTVITEDNGLIKTIKNLYFLNIRIAHERKGVARDVLGKLYEKGRFRNTLILSPPGCGKTTLLRDLVRLISDGNEYAAGQTVGLVDERSELAGSFMGIPQLDVGKRTDVLENCPKLLGMILLLRSMSPGVIAIDELGGREELEKLQSAGVGGCAILATVHGNSLAELEHRFGVERDCIANLFERVLLLGKTEQCFTIRCFSAREDWKEL